MVLSYNYSNRNRQQWQTNAPPLWAICMAMAVRRCNTQCSMTNASPEATGRRHRATTRSISPRRLPEAAIAIIITTMMQHVSTNQGCSLTYLVWVKRVAAHIGPVIIIT